MSNFLGCKLIYQQVFNDSWVTCAFGSLHTLPYKELEDALADGRADIAVHSMKDVPMHLPPGFVLAAVLERVHAEVRDVGRFVMIVDAEDAAHGASFTMPA